MKMKKFWEEFRKFISKGNIVDLAVAVIIGGAFGKIVTSLVNDLLMPLISLVFTALGLKGSAGWKWEILDKNGNIAATLNYGVFIQSILDFLIVAMCIFLILKMIKDTRVRLNKAAEKIVKKNKGGEEEPAAPETTAAESEPSTNELLIQIRDLLAAQDSKAVIEKDKDGNP